MTDRNPDDLYDALRDRLANYGQEPPAALWAGIRAQLPPPVAAPQLHRRRAPVAWLFLITLSLVAVGAAWHWGKTPSAAPTVSKAGQTPFPVSPQKGGSSSSSFSSNQQRATAANNAPLPMRGKNQPPATQAPAAAAQPPATDAPAEVSGAGAPVTAPAASTRLIATTGSHTAEAPAAAAAGTSAGTAVATAAKAAGTAHTSAGAAATTSTQAARASSAALVASRITAGRLAGRMAGPKNLAATDDRKRASSTRATRGQTQGQGSRRARTVASTASQRPGYGNPTMGAAGRAQPGRNAATGAGSRLSQALAASKNSPARHRRHPAKTLSMATKPAAGQPLPSATKLPTQDQPIAQPDLTTSLTGSTPLLAGGLQRQRTAPLPVLVVAVRLAAPPERAAPQPVAVVPGPLARPFASRWAVQVVAGPALTYRYLDASAGAAAPTSPPFVYTPAFTPVAPLERPALGSAAQATVRRTLDGHWSLSAGLGYAEYASALALQQVRSAAAGVTAANIRADSTATTGIHRRDTYRFVTVPVRVGYGWTLSGRWRVGLLAGAEAAVYVGGSTTEGSPCACQSQTWGISGSPYRHLSVGASLGAEVRYRLGEGGRWELLAQPTATYLLSPLANYTPYYQRHLFGGAALLGVALNLP